MNNTRVRITIGENQLEAVLWDSPAAQDMAEQLPLTLEFSDYGGQEVSAEPPRLPTMESMPAGESAPTGTIGYYAPHGVLVLYYTDVARFAGIVRLGEMYGDVSLLSGWTESRAVTIERIA